MRVQLVNAVYDDVAFVTQHLREVDAHEINATRFFDDPDTLAADIMSVPQFVKVAKVDGVPVAVIGARPCWPRVWAVFAFGTDAWRSVVLTLSRYVRHTMIPVLLDRDALRAVCFSTESHPDAGRWLTMLGAKREAELPDWGKGGETFHIYGWRACDVRRG